MRSDLFGKRTHAHLGYAGLAVGKRTEDDVEHAARRFEIRVELDTANEGLEETVDHLGGETLFAQCVDCGEIFVLQNRARGRALHAPTQQADARLVENVADGCNGGGNEMCGVAQRIADDVVFVVAPHQGSRMEVAHVQLDQVDFGGEFGICGEQHLKTSVEAESVDHVSAYATAHTVGGFEYQHAASGALQVTRTLQTCQACSDDDCVVRCRFVHSDILTCREGRAVPRRVSNV